MTELQPGLEGRSDRMVGSQDTALALGSGDVEVLGTPAVVALCEEAAVAAVAGSLGPDDTSVGTRIELDHLAPTPVGGRVEAVARLEAVDGRNLRFFVEARDAAGVVARGSHHRVVVDRRRFGETAAARG